MHFSLRLLCRTLRFSCSRDRGLIVPERPATRSLETRTRAPIGVWFDHGLQPETYPDGFVDFDHFRCVYFTKPTSETPLVHGFYLLKFDLASLHETGVS
jgi:hypothetical protein